jgi:class 3 adenylate cyclase
MRFTIAIIVLFFAFTIPAAAQNKRLVDSLERVLPKTPNDTHRVDLLNTLGREYFLSKPKKALKSFEQAQKAALQLNYIPGLAMSYYNLSLVHSAMGDADKAAYYKNLFNVTKQKLDDSKQISNLNGEIANKNKELEGKMKDLSAKERDLLNQEGELKQLGGALDSSKKENAGLSKELETSRLELQIKENKIKLREQESEIEIQHQIVVRNLFIAAFIILCIIAFFIYRSYKEKQKTAEELEAKNRIIAAEKERSEELLLNILPAETAEELKKYGKASPRYYSEVTVLFTDFKNFTSFAESYTPDKLVAEIDLCFRKFDEIIDRHGLEKIKTIGDAYMCASGVPAVNSNNAEAVVAAAIEIRDFMLQMRKDRKKNKEEYWEIRIGIHTGPIIAGIVGIRKFAYDIWGDTVNIASRMESSGEEGKINISGTTYALVKDKFACVYRGKVEAKNKGEIEMYFVESKA